MWGFVSQLSASWESAAPGGIRSGPLFIFQVSSHTFCFKTDEGVDFLTQPWAKDLVVTQNNKRGKLHPRFIPLCGTAEAGSVTTCWLIARVEGVYCLINWKSWNIKVTRFLSCLNGGCPTLPATAADKTRHAKMCHVFTISSKSCFPSSVGTAFNASISSHPSKWIACGNLGFALCIRKKLSKAGVAYQYSSTHRQTHSYDLDWKEHSAFRNLPTAIFLLFFTPQVSDVRADAGAAGNIPALPVIQPSCPLQTFVVAAMIQIHIFLMHFPRCAGVARC